MSKIVGADLGNDSLKIAFGTKMTFRLINAVSQRMIEEPRKDLSIESLKLVNNTIEKLDKETQSKILSDLDVIITSKYINGRYFVGDLASKNGEQEVETGTPKADNPNIVIPFLTMLALNVDEKRKEEHFNVVCGLPITEFTSDKDRFKEKLIGEYKVKFNTAALKGREVKIIIDNIVVLPEGVAVIMNQMLDDTGTKLKNPSLIEGQRGVIDIGAFTTDIPIIVKGKPDSNASDGIEEGIANYLDSIVRLINERHNVRMTRSQLVEKIEANQLSFPIKGVSTDISGYLKQQFQIFANKIVSKVDNIWANHYEIQEFFVVGGGAKALEEPLKAEMNKRKIQLTFITNEDPQMQNALGYWKYAKQKFGA
jgi:plasmid segregation protein ParM